MAKHPCPDLRRRGLIAGAAVAAVGALSPFSGANANDEELYDPVPPPDSVFVRLLDVAGEADAPDAQIGGVMLSRTGAKATAYTVLKAGTWPLQMGGTSADLVLEPGKSYSIALVASKPGYVLFEDQIVEDPRKCGLMFFNLSSAPAQLVVPQEDKEITVIDALDPGTHKTRAVNAITVDLTVKADGVEAGRFPGVKLRRRSHVTFVVTGNAGTFVAFKAENANS